MKKTYFPMFMNIEEKTFFVFGAGNIASRRVQALLRFGCKVTIEAPVISEEMKEVIKEYDVTILKREYCPGDVPEETDYVLAITNDYTVNERIFWECRHKEIPVNVASDRSQCDFYFPALAESDAITIGITSEGSDHKRVREVAAEIRNLLSE